MAEDLLNVDGPHTPGRTRQLAALATDAVRVMNHATRPGEAGLAAPADVYDLVGSVHLLAVRLPQLLGQCAVFLRDEAAAGRVGDTRRPGGADRWANITADGLESVGEQFEQLARQLARRHADLSSLYRTGDDDDE